MKYELKIQKNKNYITPKDMPDGAIGIIVRWSIKAHVGTIVQKCGNALVAIGKPKDYGWLDCDELNNSVTFAIELFESGDTITIV